MSAIVKVERQGTGAVFRANLAPNRACEVVADRLGLVKRPRAADVVEWLRDHRTRQFLGEAMSNESTEKGAVTGFWEEFRAVLGSWP